jgi:hypothetical protein
MDEFLKHIYVGEIKKQCQFALSAINHLNAALKELHASREMDAEQRSFVHAEVFRQIHSFLTHASNISRMFWPAVPKQRKNESTDQYQQRLERLSRVQRANALLAEYGINDSHCLKNRALRDHLEHYDERLDHWRETSKNRNIVSDLIGPKNSIVGLAETDMMRWFDPSDNHFRFRGEEYDLQQLASSVDGLLPASIKLEEELWNRGIRNA